ncbi:MAG: hypothetical protein LBR79_04570 [Oscillospiraceae bacterium]|nr:hypothetical protein [Oscillospiraceae bacterium]
MFFLHTLIAFRWWPKLIDNVFSPAYGGGKRRNFNYFETRPGKSALPHRVANKICYRTLHNIAIKATALLSKK